MPRGDGTPPLVERHSSGNCGAAAVTPEPSPRGSVGSSGSGNGAEAARFDPDAGHRRQLRIPEWSGTSQSAR